MLRITKLLWVWSLVDINSCVIRTLSSFHIIVSFPISRNFNHFITYSVALVLFCLWTWKCYNVKRSKQILWKCGRIQIPGKDINAQNLHLWSERRINSGNACCTSAISNVEIKIVLKSKFWARRRKSQETGENYIMTSFIMCTHPPKLLGSSNQGDGIDVTYQECERR
jgi:hypothetical protein